MSRHIDAIPGHDCTGLEDCGFCKLFDSTVEIAELDMSKLSEDSPERKLQEEFRRHLWDFGYDWRTKRWRH